MQSEPGRFPEQGRGNRRSEFCPNISNSLTVHTVREVQFEMTDEKIKLSGIVATWFPPGSAKRLAIYGFIWFILAGTDPASWSLGVPAILAATFWGSFLAPERSWPISPIGGINFLLFFLRQSFQSGIDVMHRAIAPRLLINPGLVTYDSLLPEGTPLILFANTISLLPGTLSAELEDRTITIHTLDNKQPIWALLQNLEWHVATLFRLDKSDTQQQETAKRT